MSEEKKNLKDEETKKTKELSPEELDNVSGGLYCNPEKMLWQEDLAKSRNPNGFGSTFDEWKQLQAVRKEDWRFGRQRCPSCGSWRCSKLGDNDVPMVFCWDCRDMCEPIAPTVKWGAKGRSIYYD